MDKIRGSENDLINYCIQRPIQSGLIINGPPGSGKTYLSVERIKKFIDNKEANSSKEIIILSFTRNAVREIRTRFRRKVNNKYERVNILTFDQFASRILYATKNSPELINVDDYEQNIKLATNIICQQKIFDKKREKILYDLNNYNDIFNIKHIIIDEIQDLCLNRANLIQELFLFLQKHVKEWGFTLLGDLDQEIFAYLEDTIKTQNEEKFKRSGDFLSWIRVWAKNTYKTENPFEEIELDNDLNLSYRYKELNKKVLDKIILVREILHEEKGGEAARDSHFRIKSILPRSPEITDIETLIQTISKHNGKKIALLFRNNKNARYISAMFFHHNYFHQYQLTNSKKIYPSWIGRIFSILNPLPQTNGDRIIQKNNYIEVWHKLNFEDKLNLTPNDAWKLLSFLVSRTQLDLNEFSLTLLRRNMISFFDESLMDEFGMPTSNCIVSTIHKSKGREYDIIYCEEFDIYSNNLTRKEIQNENRILYVALTRCKEDFFLINLSCKENGKQFKIDSPENLIPNYNKNKIQVLKFAIDTEDSEFIDKYSFLTSLEKVAEQRQNYIWNNIHVGDDIKIKFHFSERNEWIGELLHNNIPVGYITKEYCKKYLQRFERDTKDTYEIDGAKVVALTTEIIDFNDKKVDIQAFIPLKYMEIGFWIGFRIMGILYVHI